MGDGTDEESSGAPAGIGGILRLGRTLVLLLSRRSTAGACCGLLTERAGLSGEPGAGGILGEASVARAKLAVERLVGLDGL